MGCRIIAIGTGDRNRNGGCHRHRHCMGGHCWGLGVVVVVGGGDCCIVDAGGGGGSHCRCQVATTTFC